MVNDCDVLTDQSAEMAMAFSQFLQTYPEYKATQHIDELRATDYAVLDERGATYVDYTGSSLYSRRQVDLHHDFLSGHLLGNPHSINPTSEEATAHVERVRLQILRFFNADPDEYAVIFTPNASGSMRLVGEAFPFDSESTFLLSFDNHNSVNGMREYARAKDSAVQYVPLVVPELRIDESALMPALDSGTGLFAYPAQSNFSGVQHPLRYVDEARARGWMVLLDCAAFVPTNALDLQQVQPDFAPISFYKMFGYPTGIGCLLARKEALGKLRRPWFAGGSIRAVSVQGNFHYLAEGAEGFEDGTLDFLNIPAVGIGLEHLSAIGVLSIQHRVRALTAWMLQTLLSLRHSNGREVVHVYGPSGTHCRGANIAFNFVNPDGHIVDERFVDARAADANISLRTGCFCNPGAGEAAFNLSEELLADFHPTGAVIMDEYLTQLHMESGGAIRVSLGIASNFADVYRVLELARTFVDDTSKPGDLPPRVHC